MSEPVWLPGEIILAIHDEQIAEHGGLAGVRDSGLLDSAPARPQNAFSYGETELCALAALYAARDCPEPSFCRRKQAVRFRQLRVVSQLEWLASDSR